MQAKTKILRCSILVLERFRDSARLECSGKVDWYHSLAHKQLCNCSQNPRPVLLFYCSTSGTFNVVVIHQQVLLTGVLFV